MPVVDDFPQRPQSGPPRQDADDAWAMPLGTISGLRLYLSYSVFVAAAVLIGVLWVLHNRQGGSELPYQQGNADLPTIALIGLAFWSVGWIVQFAVYAFYRFAVGAPIESLTIGLLGIESRVRNWEAKTALIVTTTSLISLIFAGVMVIFAEQIVHNTNPWEQLFEVRLVLSFGLGAADHLWLAGAWLLWVQAACQMYPIPKSTGRVAIVSTIALLAQRLDEPFQTHFSRRSLQMVAFITAVFAAGILVMQTSVGMQQWPFLMLLAVLLWVSSRGPDVQHLVLSYGTFSHWKRDGVEPVSQQDDRLNWVDRAKHSIGSASRRRHLRRVLKNEHQEAVDAQRLGAVLTQLHEQGRDSLSEDDLSLLQRVSDSLRRERERTSSEDTSV